MRAYRVPDFSAWGIYYCSHVAAWIFFRHYVSVMLRRWKERFSSQRLVGWWTWQTRHTCISAAESTTACRRRSKYSTVTSQLWQV